MNFNKLKKMTQPLSQLGSMQSITGTSIGNLMSPGI